MNKSYTLEIVMVSMNNVQDFRRSIESIEPLISNFDRVVIVDSSKNSEIENESKSLSDLEVNVVYQWEEPQGIYHAMNTGLNLCHDDSLVWFLNPGDVAKNPSLILELKNLIEKSDSRWGYGQSSYDNDFSACPRLFPDINDNSIYSLFDGELQISHQSMLVSKETLLELGGFETKFSIAADLDLQFKLIADFSPQFLPKHLIIVDTSGVSHNQQVRTLIESFIIRYRRNEFSKTKSIAWLLRSVSRRVYHSNLLRIRNAN